ncbi:hypothetical protein J3E69DRAFT_366817 [Trichoderma sp. SZMC 28015]
MTPLLVAGSTGELQSIHVINMLLDDSRVDGHARDDDGCNACMLAAKHVQGKIIAGLLPTLHDAGDGDQRLTPEKDRCPTLTTQLVVAYHEHRSLRKSARDQRKAIQKCANSLYKWLKANESAQKALDEAEADFQRVRHQKEEKINVRETLLNDRQFRLFHRLYRIQRECPIVNGTAGKEHSAHDPMGRLQISHRPRAYPHRPLGSHEDYTRDIAQSMEAKAEDEKVREIATFSKWDDGMDRQRQAEGFMFHDRAEAVAVHTGENQQKASMMANKIDELIPFETYKEGFEENSTEKFPSLSDFYPNNSTLKLKGQELVEDLQHGSIRQPRCFATFCSFKGRDMDPWVGFILGLPFGKEQIGNEQKGFGVCHAFARGVGGGAASKSVFDLFPNAKGREKGLTVIRVSLADETCVTVSGFGMSFANADDAQIYVVVRLAPHVASKRFSVDKLPPPIVYPYGTDQEWNVFKFKNLIKANGGHQFETADSQTDDNHHMTAVNQSNVQDVMWLDDAAIEIAVTKFPAYFVRRSSRTLTKDNMDLHRALTREQLLRLDGQKAARIYCRRQVIFICG